MFGRAFSRQIRILTIGGSTLVALLSTVFAATPKVEPTRLPGPPQPVLTERTEAVERDFALRSIGELQITNARGDVIVEGWSQDKIRLKGVKRVRASNDEEAKTLFSATDFRFKSDDGDVELTVEYGRGMKIEDRLKERQDPRTSVDITILAPSNLPLRIWAVNGKVSVKNWNSSAEVRTFSGPIAIDSVKKGKHVTVLCPECPVTIRSVNTSVRCMGGRGALDLKNVHGSQVYVESEAGPITLQDVSGEQLYVSKSGPIRGVDLSGRIEFHTHDGAVEILKSSGFLSGKTESGSIQAVMTHWEFLDKALLESRSGSIRLGLPGSFSGEVDLKSVYGHVSSAFPLVQPGGTGQSSPTEVPALMAARRMTGWVADGGELLKISSERGDVSLLRSD